MVLTCGTVASADERRDPTLEALVAEAVTATPELARAAAEVRAARERVPQAQAWSDPMLQVGVQNDSFTRWNVGRMETSWVSLLASQTFPFPGKNGLRAEVADGEVRQKVIAADRVRLTTVAEVRRAYVGLQLATARRGLVERLITLWDQAALVAQTRYESADGSQADLLRARLERARLNQRRRLLELEERRQSQTLNRLRQKPLGEAIEGVRPLASLDFPTAPDEETLLAEARLTSPELLAARLGQQRALAQHELAGHLALPDVTVGAGVMLRGALDPMWTVTVGVPLPVVSGPRQTHALSEAAAVHQAATDDVASVEQLLTLRTRQRLDAWRTLAEQAKDQHDVLRQADATVESALGQYRAGKLPLASVLETSATRFVEADAALRLLADAWRLAIASAEVSLDQPDALEEPR